MVPNFEKFFSPYLSFMGDGKVHSLKELVDFISKTLNLTDEDRREMTKKGSFTRVYDRTQWTGSYFRQAKLIESKGRGVYQITQRGLDLLNTHKGEITHETLCEFPEFLEFSGKKSVYKKDNDKIVDSIIITDKTPSEMMEIAYQQMSEHLTDELLDKVKSQTPLFFENLVVKLLVAMGYGGSFDDAAKVTQYSHDDGIDGIIKEDKLGLDSIYIQAKRYTTGAVPKPDIQKFIGALSEKGATKGIFITTNIFSTGAIETAKQAKNVKVVLVDGKTLAKYMFDYNIGVSIKQIYEIKNIDMDFFEEA